MSTVPVQSATPAVQTAPRGARLAAAAYLGASRWLRAALRRLTAAAPPPPRAAQAAALDALAWQLRLSHPAWPLHRQAIEAQMQRPPSTSRHTPVSIEASSLHR